MTRSYRTQSPVAYSLLTLVLACGNASPDNLFANGLGGGADTGVGDTGGIETLSTTTGGTSTGGTLARDASDGGRSSGGTSTGGAAGGSGGAVEPWSLPTQSNPERPDLYDEGACINEVDLAIDCGFDDKSNECGKPTMPLRDSCVNLSTAPLTAEVDESCVAECLQTELPTGSSPCIACYATLMKCASIECKSECVFNGASIECRQCVHNKCGSGEGNFVDCSGRSTDPAVNFCKVE
ncbi:MAG: hypothetical protein HRU17_17455 [Polyangiaceae bacterium]|nr:hypothetical protein [Polyangiaceae bacterium]